MYPKPATAICKQKLSTAIANELLQQYLIF